MLKILSTYICWTKIYKMQYLEGSGLPVLYIGRTVLKGKGVFEGHYTILIVARHIGMASIK
jgi:hypothetical protein